MADFGAIGVDASAVSRRESRDWSVAKLRMLYEANESADLNYRPGVSNVVAGVVKENATPVSGRTVIAFRRDNRAHLGEAITDGSGLFSIALNGYAGEVFVVALDDSGGVSYNARIYDKVTGV